MTDVLIMLWIFAGWGGWIFTGYRWKTFNNWEFYLFLPVHAPVLGPFMWLVSFIQD